jgi:uncharacterized membrane protein
MKPVIDLLVRFGRNLSPVGLAMAVVFFCGSLTPSLVPRSWPYQALISGISLATGYALGVLLGWFGRRIGIRSRWSAQTRRRGWIAFALASVVSIIVYMVLGARWQAEIRALFGMPDVPPAFVLVLFVAVALALVALSLVRGLRLLIRLVARPLKRWIPSVVAYSASFVVVVVVAVLTFNGTIVAGVMSGLNDTYQLLDQGTEPGVVPPTTEERTGSPASPVRWESLGLRGRSFVAGGPAPTELAVFAEERGRIGPVHVPIRVYAGLDRDADLENTAAVVMAELDRTNAWDREVLAVVTTTGTGWVPPAAIEALEFMHAGDTAVAAMQYSYLPSPVSFIADRETPPAAAKALFEAVYEVWSELSEERRPRLVTYGESLGGYGGQGAFSGLQDMTVRTDGALWVGTPSFTENWRFLTENRDPGSPQYKPVYEQGRQVRWIAGPSGSADLWGWGAEWEEPRVVYIQHPTDGVVWWSPDLILNRPDWLREPLGPGVHPRLRWIPVITFWQVTMDMFVSGQMPSGYGHSYVEEYAVGWAAVAPPEGWTYEDTAALSSFIGQRHADEPDPLLVPDS